MRFRGSGMTNEIQRKETLMVIDKTAELCMAD